MSRSISLQPELLQTNIMLNHSSFENFQNATLTSSGLTILKAIALSTLVAWAIVANSLVFVILYKNTKLRTVPNLLVSNQALSDFLIALVVLPPSVTYAINSHWILGQLLCEVWLTFDIFTCTASIWNLSVIGLDRYWAITQPVRYMNKRTPRLAARLIGGVWLLSAAISIAPLLGWKQFSKDGNYVYDNGTETYQCIHFNDLASYTIYSAMGSFYMPFALMFFVYARIFCAFRAHQNRIKQRHAALKQHLAADLPTFQPPPEADKKPESSDTGQKNSEEKSSQEESPKDAKCNTNLTSIRPKSSGSSALSNIEESSAEDIPQHVQNFQNLTTKFPKNPFLGVETRASRRRSDLGLLGGTMGYGAPKGLKPSISAAQLSHNDITITDIPYFQLPKPLPTSATFEGEKNLKNSQNLKNSKKCRRRSFNSLVVLESAENSKSEDTQCLLDKSPQTNSDSSTRENFENLLQNSSPRRGGVENRIEIKHTPSRTCHNTITTESTSNPIPKRRSQPVIAKKRSRFSFSRNRAAPSVRYHSSHPTLLLANAAVSSCQKLSLISSSFIDPTISQLDVFEALNMLPPSSSSGGENSNFAHASRPSMSLGKRLSISFNARSTGLAGGISVETGVITPITRGSGASTKKFSMNKSFVRSKSLRFAQGIASARPRGRRRVPQSISTEKEKRGIVVLGVILGCFTVCWLPFFIMYQILSFCKICSVSPIVEQLITWLGYANSAINPIIYTVFNPEYQTALKRLFSKKENMKRHGTAVGTQKANRDT